jgi:hypothetical protein
LDCSLTNAQVRIVSLLTVRHWKAAYPWSAQAKTALKAGLDPAVIEAINDGTETTISAIQPIRQSMPPPDELLATGTLSDDGFKAAEKTLGYQRVSSKLSARSGISAQPR